MLTPAELFTTIRKRLPLEVSKAFSQLIQRKHLYQSEIVDTSYIDTEFAKVDKHVAAAVRHPIDPLLKGPWLPSQPSGSNVPPIGHIDSITQHLSFPTNTAKLFCETCDRVEAFNPLLIEDITERSGYESRPPKLIQVFAFSFLCQSCKLVPEVFLVRRVNLKLTLCGRAPMEHVYVPTVIPKNQQRHFSDAMVAFQAGQILPGLFMLRTTIEQFVRERYGKPVDTREQLNLAFDSYMASLPETFRSTFPSLPDLYTKLSLSLHAADASADFFNLSRNAIEKHFDARRIYDLP